MLCELLLLLCDVGIESMQMIRSRIIACCRQNAEDECVYVCADGEICGWEFYWNDSDQFSLPLFCRIFSFSSSFFLSVSLPLFRSLSLGLSPALSIENADAAQSSGEIIITVARSRTFEQIKVSNSISTLWYRSIHSSSLNLYLKYIHSPMLERPSAFTLEYNQHLNWGFWRFTIFPLHSMNYCEFSWLIWILITFYRCVHSFHRKLLSHGQKKKKKKYEYFFIC